MKNIFTDKVVLVGDVHGDFRALRAARKQFPDLPIIQIGDLGIGFWDHKKLKQEHPGDNFYYIRGNHDNPAATLDFAGYLGDYGCSANEKVMWVSGAHSIDKDDRTPTIDWWEGEELSYQQCGDVVDMYTRIKPEVMITHDCPLDLYTWLGIPEQDVVPNKTANLLSSLLEIHKPKRWFFGHHHKRLNMTIQGVDFRCLDIDEITCINLK